MIDEKTKLKINLMNYKKINSFFINACRKGNLDIVKYLLVNNNLTHKPILEYENLEWFRVSCRKGHLHIVEYVLTLPQSKSFDINGRDDVGIRNACLSGNLELVKFLAESEKLNKHGNINARQNEGFWWALENEQSDIVNYFATNKQISHPLIINHNTFNVPNKGNPIFGLANRKKILSLNLARQTPQLNHYFWPCLKNYPDIKEELLKFELVDTLESTLEQKKKTSNLKI